MNDKVIFLDCDGVLTSSRIHLAQKFPNVGGLWKDWDIYSFRFLKNFCTKYDYKIVISSSWRYGAKELLKINLNKEEYYKLQEVLHPDWYTPYTLGGLDTRGKEIAAWLDYHKDIKHYIIIDDDSDMLYEQKKFFVHTDGENGMTYENYRQIRDMAR